jgi:hypothetical protein
MLEKKDFPIPFPQSTWGILWPTWISQFGKQNREEFFQNNVPIGRYDRYDYMTIH